MNLSDEDLKNGLLNMGYHSAYDLDEKPFEVVADPKKFGRIWGDPRRVVKQTSFFRRGQEYRVSTVHIVINHAWQPGPPMIYETMVFTEDPRWDSATYRYSTRSSAKKGHGLVLREVQEDVRRKGNPERPRYKYLPGRNFHRTRG